MLENRLLDESRRISLLQSACRRNFVPVWLATRCDSLSSDMPSWDASADGAMSGWRLNRASALLTLTSTRVAPGLGATARRKTSEAKAPVASGAPNCHPDAASTMRRACASA